MLEKYFIKPQTVDEIRNSWIGASIERYVVWLEEHGYATRVFYQRVPILKQFGVFTQENGAKTLEELPLLIEPFVYYWVQKHGKNCKTLRATKSVESEARNPIQQMLALILPDYQSESCKLANKPFINIAPNFFTHLRNERGLSPRTIKMYVFYLKRFEKYLTKINCDVKNISSVIMNAFVTDSKKDLGQTSISGMCNGLKVFFRYLFREGLTNQDMSKFIETQKKYQLANIPRSISWENIQQMLDAVERRTPTGKRDYAMLLLLITYGLRANEVAKLTLDDIDWNRERLRVPERKAGHSTAYPLSSAVAEAIIIYIKEARPKTEDRHLFFRVFAPYTPLSYHSVSTRTTYYLRKAGIDAFRRGSHTLRHSCVQRLLEAHVPLKTIGDYVGHRSPSSTKIYTKIDIDALREVALTHGEEVI